MKKEKQSDRIRTKIKILLTSSQELETQWKMKEHVSWMYLVIMCEQKGVNVRKGDTLFMGKHLHYK